MGHAMDGAGAPRGGEYREPVSGTNGIYALYHASVAGDVPGMWQRYYSRWRETTRERINPALLELLPAFHRAGSRTLGNVSNSVL